VLAALAYYSERRYQGFGFLRPALAPCCGAPVRARANSSAKTVLCVIHLLLLALTRGGPYNTAGLIMSHAGDGPFRKNQRALATHIVVANQPPTSVRIMSIRAVLYEGFALAAATLRGLRLDTLPIIVAAATLEAWALLPVSRMKNWLEAAPGSIPIRIKYQWRSALNSVEGHLTKGRSSTITTTGRKNNIMTSLTPVHPPRDLTEDF